MLLKFWKWLCQKQVNKKLRIMIACSLKILCRFDFFSISDIFFQRFLTQLVGSDATVCVRPRRVRKKDKGKIFFGGGGLDSVSLHLTVYGWSNAADWLMGRRWWRSTETPARTAASSTASWRRPNRRRRASASTRAPASSTRSTASTPATNSPSAWVDRVFFSSSYSLFFS